MDTTDAPKKYTPPNSQRNRPLNRKKSAEKFEGEKSQGGYSRNFQPVNQTEVANNNFQNQTSHPRMIPLHGCSTSEVSLLLNERWVAALNSCNDPSTDPSERPIMYSGVSGSSWGHFKLPHQMDFLSQLQRAIESGPPKNAERAASGRI